jgi:hypothetical protein
MDGSRVSEAVRHQEPVRHGGSRRYDAPAQLPGATAFSQDGTIRSALWLIETVQAHAWLSAAVEAVVPERNWGRRRNPGSWPLMFLAFALSDSVDVQPWYDKSDESLWLAAGFLCKPPYKTVYERFVDLESRAGALDEVAGLLIRAARARDPRVGAYLHVDSTEAETHAAFVHDCTVEEGCPWAIEEARRGERRSARRPRTSFEDRTAAEAVAETEPEGAALEELDALAAGDNPSTSADADASVPQGVKPAERPDRVPTLVPRADRQSKGAGPPSDELEIGKAERVVIGPETIRVRVGGHWYRSLDTTAGVRAYNGRRRSTVRFWHGFYNMKMTDHYTGAPVAIGLYSASRQEHLCYEDMLDRAERNIGTRPLAVVGDRGYSVRSVFETNTQRGIASVFPWRKHHENESRADNYVYDRHGIPRCKYCGAATEFVRFAHEPYPRLWVRCLTAKTEACREPQTHACSKDWRALLPLWRDDPVYMELRATHGLYESVHDYWRDRYKVGPSGLGQRPKRRGIEWQQLRASAALVVEWLRISYREGWLDGGERRNQGQAKAAMEHGRKGATRLRQFRIKSGLVGPYGPRAVEAYGTRRYRRTPHERWQVICAWEARNKLRAKEARRRNQQAA